MPVDEQHRWPCQQCGAELRYAPGQTALKCDHCGYEQVIKTGASGTFQEHPLANGLANDLPPAASVDIRSTHCPNCGAIVEFQGASHATECPFCASPVVVDTGTQRRIKPQAIVPFAYDEPSARKALIGWLGSLWFAPNRLLEYTRAGRAMTGIYVPYWTFDAATHSRYRGAKGVHYYETRTVTVNVNGRNEQRQEQVRRTQWYPAAGQVARDFDDVLVIASTSLTTDLAEDLAPWDLSQLQGYSADFLAGFQAEGYTVALSDGHQVARGKMTQAIANDVRHDIGGDEQRIDNIDSDFQAETFKHVLLPVWMAAYKYGGKTYRFLVNGQTGEVQGERPYSAFKIAFAIISAVVLVAAAAYVYDPSIFGLQRPAWLPNFTRR